MKIRVGDERTPHWVKPNESVRVPRRHVFLDTESRTEQTPGGHVQSWRCAVACYRTSRPDRKPQERWADYDDPAILWKDIDAFCLGANRVVVWAHNLGYDARIAGMFTHLPGMGWQLTAFNITPRGTWFQWRDGRRTLVLTDSGSIFTTTLAQVGKWFGMSKVELPDYHATPEQWLERCRRDVEILRTAIVTYLQWIVDGDLGNWQLTGAGQSMAAFRHKFLTHKILVHDDAAAMAAERRAMWAGRCEAYWHGALHGQVIHEWDLSLAYARVALDTNLPIRLLGPMPEGYDWMAALHHTRTALLAEVSVTTEVPVVPAAHNGRIIWPVGTFNTTLWDIEISEAIAAGAQVTVHRGWFYRKAPVMQSWARWVIDSLEAPDSEVPAWQKAIVKHWSRATPGRWAMTYTDWEDFAETPTAGLLRSTVYDRDTDETYEIMQVGTKVWRDAGRTEWSQSVPAITGYIQAATRVRLWRIMQALPREAALYADTDSILCTDRHLSTLDSVAQSGLGVGLRLKKSWDGFAIYGPRQIVTGNQVRVSGVPRNAQRVERHRFAGEVWHSLSHALKVGKPDQVETRDREWNVRCVDNRRVGPAVGWTEPIRLPIPA